MYAAAQAARELNGEVRASQYRACVGQRVLLVDGVCEPYRHVDKDVAVAGFGAGLRQQRGQQRWDP